MAGLMPFLEVEEEARRQGGRGKGEGKDDEEITAEIGYEAEM